MSPASETAAPASTESAAPAAEAAPRPRRRRKTASDSTEAPAASQTDAPAAEEKPKRTRARRKTSVADDAVAAPASDAVSAEVAQARALAQVSQASVVRRQRRAEARAEELIAQGGAPREDATPAPEIPLVDPALRPHRRGRKPKAYLEAERAAAAALAAQGAAQAPEAGSAPAAPEADKRPGRSRRAKEKPAEAEEPKQEETPASDAGEHEEEKRGRQSRRAHTHDRRRERDGAEHAAAGSSAPDRPAERQNRRAQQRNKRNNRFSAPSEPTLSRDELNELKVAELREKAHELDLDVTGKKKAELVEEVYQAAARAEGFRDVNGILDISSEGFGHLRVHGYSPSRDDVFVPANLIRAARLRAGDRIQGTARPQRANDKFPALSKIQSINGCDPEQMRTRPKFADLTPIYPNEPLKMEHGKDSITGRAIDIVAPVGKGQRGLIVSPPKAGKTTILKKICQSIAINNPEVHVICLLVDERPEEVTDMQRSIAGEVVASTFDMPADNHTRVSELVIERAKRIVELGGDVVVVLDSITRLARAYNLAAPASGRILSGGVDSAALYPPKRFLGAARNIENGGSLTILASALVETGSKMDEVIFEEFKGTGNMELKLDRDLADRRIFPAIDPVASGTRNEDLLIDEQMRPFVWGIRRVLANMTNTERAASAFIKGLRSTNSNREFLIRSAKRANEHADSLPL